MFICCDGVKTRGSHSLTCSTPGPYLVLLLREVLEASSGGTYLEGASTGVCLSIKMALVPCSG